MKTFKVLPRLMASFGLVMIFTSTLWGLATSVSGSTAAQLAAAIQGNGITISNPILKRSNSQQAGTFSNGINGAHLEVDSGIILTTMSVAEAFTTNDSGSKSIANGNTYEDNDLKNIDPKAKYDTVIFEFDVTLGANTKLLLVNYQFASEEYNEYVGSQYNDAFGFFISGGDLTQTYNIARVVNDSTIVTTANISNYPAVTINNVNNGTLGGNADGTPTILTNSQYFIDNTPNNHPVDVEFDGLTHRLHATLDNLTPGVTYHFKMALADTGDNQLDTGVFVDKITGIRAPQMCYDYAYKQNGQYITNKSYLGVTPRIDGTVISGTPVDVQLYVKNQESSELIAQNLKMSILDMNTSQAIYKTGSVNVLLPGKIAVTPIADNTNGMSVANSYIKNIPIGSVAANEYFYTNYSISPLIGDLNMSLDANISFQLLIQGVTIPYDNKLGTNIPMCTSTASYSPASGIYNMVDQRANLGTALNANSTTVKNNLPTQVANRPTSLEIVSYDPVNFNTVKASNTMLAVEIIDMAGFFDTNASCHNPNSAITKRAWVQFGKADANITHTVFDSSLLGTGLNTGVSSGDYFKNIRENAAYRLSYNLDDNNGSVQVDEVVPGRYKLKYFTTYAGQVCTSDVDGNLNNIDTVPHWCGNNGGGNGSGMTPSELATCMECIYGKKTRNVCSRDNFSIRPEALKVNITDGAITIPADANLSAHYSYRFDLNATNHLDSTATPGYVAFYNSAIVDPDRNATLKWSPNGRDVSGCNDISDPAVSFYFIDGIITNQMRDHNNTGRYQLQLRDQKWTSVDKETPSHHIGTTNWLSGGDCIANSDSVPLYSNTNTYANNMVGCVISSQHTKLSAPTAQFNDYNLSFRPYQFDLSTLVMGTGMNYGNTINTAVAPVIPTPNITKWTYINDLNLSDQMGVRYSGSIVARGKNNAQLSNFVDHCFAEPLDLNSSLVFPAVYTGNGGSNLDATTHFDYRLNITTDTNATDYNNTASVTPAPRGAQTYKYMTLPTSAFLKDQNGSTSMNLTVNFDRNQTLPQNPIILGMDNFQVKCTTGVNCISIADGVTNKSPDRNLSSDANVTFVYGRLATKDVRIFGQNTFAPNGWYEVFNLPSFNTVSYQASKNDINWFINSGHDDISHGDSSVTRLISSAAATTVNYGGNDVMGVETFSFPAIAPTYNGKAHVDTAPWLWYAPNALPYSDPSTTNPANAAGNDAACLTHPCFNVTVMPAIGATGSAKSTNEADKDSKTSTSGGGGWKSTTDYAPAIR